METCPEISYGGYPWQATLPGILRDIREGLVVSNTTSARCHQVVKKKLTTEACVMIGFILVFVILNLIRSLMSVYEYFKVSSKETQSSTVERKAKSKDGNACTLEEKKLLETSNYSVSIQKFLDCFCLKSNAKRLLSSVRTQEQLSCLDGIRGITVIWILIGHYSMLYAAIVKSPDSMISLMKLQSTQIVQNATFVIDLNLLLSGFLNGYVFSQYYKEKKGKISWISFYLHRYVRLSPLYFIIIGFYSTLFTYLGSGPIWPAYDTNPVCKESWMWHVLYLHNFLPHTKQCLITTWYLACEMQLCIISPLFLIMLIRRPKCGYILAFLGIIGSCFFNFIITKEYELLDGSSRLSEHYATNLSDFQRRFFFYYEALYSKPYSRIGTFLIGMVLGCSLFRRKSALIVKSNPVILSLGWITSIIFLWSSMMALHGRPESVFETALYNGLKHTIFSCGVSWIIFVCVTGQGGKINRFLSNYVFTLVSRLSYSLLLSHAIFLQGYFLAKKELIDYQSFQSIIIPLPELFFWMISIAFVVSLVFEAPILRMTALLFGKSNQEVKTNNKQE